MATTYMVRLFGGRDCGLVYDSVAGTLSILNQSISISSLSSPLQALLADAILNAGPPGSRPAFGGSNVGRAVGEILDNQPTWRRACQLALDNYIKSLSPGNMNGDVETFNRI